MNKETSNVIFLPTLSFPMWVDQVLWKYVKSLKIPVNVLHSQPSINLEKLLGEHQENTLSFWPF